MAPNNYDKEEPYRDGHYHDRKFVLTKPRDRFGSNGSTRRAFSNVAQYNFTDIPGDKTKVVPPRIDPVTRDKGLPPSSSSSQFKQSNYRARNGRTNISEGNDSHTPVHSGFGGIGTMSTSNDAHLSKSPHRQRSRDNLMQNRVYDAPPYSPNAKLSETKGLLQHQKHEQEVSYTEFDQPFRGGHAKYDDAINGNVSPYNDDARSQINAFSNLALGLTGSDLNDSLQSDDHLDFGFDFCLRFYTEKRTKWFYDDDNPEFTSLQQINWAIVIGVLMGFFTAVWAILVDLLIEIVWKKVPETLYEWGIFTDLYGPRPLPHYIWLCTAFFGGLLSFITVSLPKPIPGQNEWIKSLHRKGVIEFDTIHYIFLIAVTGMASGLSLGPELPLVLTSGMAGSFFAKITRQSVLSSRVMNLTAASAAIGGFFGFPMAGALFVLELPHRMGLQYFEALHPAIVASIASVITNRIVSHNDVKGYFNYPFLVSSLPSHIFYVAIVYGLVGGFVGICYTKGFLFLKTNVHDLFHAHDDHNEGDGNHGDVLPTNGSLSHSNGGRKSEKSYREGPIVFHSLFSCYITNEKLRATIVGIIAGAIVGIVGMFLPALLFWGKLTSMYSLLFKSAENQTNYLSSQYIHIRTRQ